MAIASPAAPLTRNDIEELEHNVRDLSIDIARLSQRLFPQLTWMALAMIAIGIATLMLAATTFILVLVKL